MSSIDTSASEISGLSDIIDAYQGVILDLWGVLHDGVTANPGAIDALRQLRDRDVRTCLLSNSPRRRTHVASFLASLGIDRDLYADLITSGELTFQALRNPEDAWHAALGQRCFHLGPASLEGLLDGSGRVIVSTPAEADFVLATGTDRAAAIESYLPTLGECAERRLPMICANPDLVVFVGAASTICAGTLAQRYESMGGDVFYHGKPHPAAYQRALADLDLDGLQVLAVGDSFRTDVAGAVGAGIDVVFIASGIHRNELFCVSAGVIDPMRLIALTERSSAQPHFVQAEFRW